MTPTPADLAARPARRPSPSTARAAAPVKAARTQNSPEAPARPRPTAADAIAPGRLRDGEQFRKFYLFGLRFSGMPGHARLLGHDLMWRVSHTTGRMAPKLQPSSEALAQATGLTTGQVDVALQVLYSRGWLRNRRVQEGPRTGSTAFELVIPAWALDQIRGHLRRNPADSHLR